MNSYDLSGLEVLIVETQPLMRRLVRGILKQLGIRNIVETSDTEEGYRLFIDNSPDIILIDWTPRLDGPDFIQRVRMGEDSPNPFTPIIVVTAYSEIKHVCKARDAGMTEYLCKPISAKSLYLRICSVIDRERLFIRSNKFFGPDRRRRIIEHSGKERRSHANRNGVDRRISREPFDGNERRHGNPGFQGLEPRQDTRR